MPSCAERRSAIHNRQHLPNTNSGAIEVQQSVLGRAVRCRSAAAEGVDANVPVARRLVLEVPGARGASAQITLETGEIGRQAGGAVTVTSGETVVYCTACAEGDPDAFEEGAGDGQQMGGMVPLTVVYQERFSAAGRTAGGYLKRDGRPRDADVLVSRLVDRPIRPMFRKNWQRDTQVISWLLSYDGEVKPEPLAITAAGAALSVSDIPLSAPVCGVRVARVEGELVVNPTAGDLEQGDLDLMVAGTQHGVLMIEGSADLVPSEVVLEAVELGHEAVRSMCRQIESWAEEVGKPKREVSKQASDVDSAVSEIMGREEGEIRAAISVRKKQERAEKLTELKEQLRLRYAEGEDAICQTQRHYNAVFKQLMSDVVRKMVVEEGMRIDGRGLDDVRPITSRASVLPRTHGSALFTRGEVGTGTLAPSTFISTTAAFP